LGRIAADDRACVIYEAPSRVPATLRDLAASAGPDRRAAVCRELTKLHEEVVRGGLGELAAAAESGSLTLRGEFVIVVEALTAATRSATGADSDAQADIPAGREQVDRLVASGLKRSEAVRQVSASTGLNRRELYRPG
jgi:16S rRNA (cytidine1402-2'-O)-methyltransferase